MMEVQDHTQNRNASQIDILHQSDFQRDLCLVLLSTLSFLVVRYFLYLFSVLPKSLDTDRPEKLYWFNVLGSLVHSTVSGIWCLSCFYTNPQMARDLIHGHDSLAHALVAVSTGYFIYDVIDNVWMLPLSKSWEIILHHVVVINCFGISVFQHQYVGYATVALLVEVNSIFLHIRQLLRLAKTDLSSFLYKFNSVLNLISFIVFRICVLAYMTYWLWYADVPQPLYGIGVSGMFVMTVMNAVLFVRLLIKDFFKRDPKRIRQESHKLTNGVGKEISNGIHNHAKEE